MEKERLTLDDLKGFVELTLDELEGFFGDDARTLYGGPLPCMYVPGREDLVRNANDEHRDGFFVYAKGSLCMNAPHGGMLLGLPDGSTRTWAPGDPMPWREQKEDTMHKRCSIHHVNFPTNGECPICAEIGLITTEQQLAARIERAVAGVDADDIGKALDWAGIEYDRYSAHCESRTLYVYIYRSAHSMGKRIKAQWHSEPLDEPKRVTIEGREYMDVTTDVFGKREISVTVTPGEQDYTIGPPHAERVRGVKWAEPRPEHYCIATEDGRRFPAPPSGWIRAKKSQYLSQLNRPDLEHLLCEIGSGRVERWEPRPGSTELEARKPLKGDWSRFEPCPASYPAHPDRVEPCPSQRPPSGVTWPTRHAPKMRCYDE